MNRAEHLLTITGEEAVEVAQRCSKTLRFGVNEKQEGQDATNSDRFYEEFDQLLAMVEMLEAEGVVVPPKPNIRMQTKDDKKAKVEKYLLYSAKQGTLSAE